jgi:hypothetical protein
MRPITYDDLSTSFIRIDPALHAATYLVQPTKPGGEVRTCRLDGADKILLSDVLSFHLEGMEYYRSIRSIGEIIGLSDRAVGRKLQLLNQLGFLVVTVNRNSFNQTNTIVLGPETLKLFVRSGENSGRNVERAQPEATAKASNPPKEPAKHAPKPNEPKEPKATRTAPSVLLTSADAPIPRKVFSRLDYYPDGGRHEFTESDAEIVFELYGQECEQALAWQRKQTENKWRAVSNKLDACKVAAHALQVAAKMASVPKIARADYD